MAEVDTNANAEDEPESGEERVADAITLGQGY